MLLLVARQSKLRHREKWQIAHRHSGSSRLVSMTESDLMVGDNDDWDEARILPRTVAVKAIWATLNTTRIMPSGLNDSVNNEQKGFSAEHSDVTVKSTFERLPIESHHFMSSCYSYAWNLIKCIDHFFSCGQKNMLCEVTVNCTFKSSNSESVHSWGFVQNSKTFPTGIAEISS